jgi:signal transduction histidine kinase
MEHQRSEKPRSPMAPAPRRLPEPRFAAGTGENPMTGVDDPDAGRGLREDDVAQLVHDLRDPIATIALEAYAIDRKLANSAHCDLRTTAARIIRNVEFLDRMVEDLLDSCAIGAGHLEIHRRPTELRSLLEQVIERVVPTRDCGRVTLDAPYPIMLRIDDLRIGRVVANLIGNALKYGPQSGEVVVRLEAGALAAHVSVIDAGPGLTAQEMEYIFDRYRRGAGAHRRVGRGLGLYVCKNIVEAHGGRIGVDSAAGGSSRFYFELPAISR